MNIKDIEVGMYVRTAFGEIGVVSYKDFEQVTIDYKVDGEIFYSGKGIKKASHNIIDVIEVGDYVNGERCCSGGWGHIITENGSCFSRTDIKSIVTKEYFEKGKFVL